jgi:hypothetical protein
MASKHFKMVESNLASPSNYSPLPTRSSKIPIVVNKAPKTGVSASTDQFKPSKVSKVRRTRAERKTSQSVESGSDGGKV